MWRWHTDADRAAYCADCIALAKARAEMSGKRAGKPRCSRCSFRCPRLLPENGPAFALWQEVCGQWRVGFGGRYALDWSAVFAISEHLGFEMDAHTWPKLRALERATLQDDAERREKDSRNKEGT